MDTSPDGTTGSDSGDDWNDPDASDADGSPASSFPGAGERVDESDRRAALDAEPEGNATVGDAVDTDAVDSSAHESGVGADEVADGVEQPGDRVGEQPAEESVEDDD
ncbi:hypothetical protein [Nocardioides sp. Soil805]|uniref:hypothetical protein n=1 Tax=Nocardioides sp. Soil805 TaxID=1736416 RepID=UPI00070345A3|nr:hypothetical protein [Nocardioides sp. Soil805]KRF37662.1 hypothetical protein ASG94_10305 [Nocardioides sp. Soil805]